MKTDRGGLAALLATMTVMSAAATSAAAQTPQAAPVRGLEGLGNPAGQDASSPSTIPIPDAPKIVLPGGTQTQTRRAPRPRVAAPATERSATERPTTARPTTERSVTRAEPKPRTRIADEPATGSSPDSAPAPIATETPAPTVNPAPIAASPTAAPQTETTPQPEATPTPTPTPAPEAAVTAPETGRSMPFWLWLAVIVVVIAALWALRRRKPGAPDHEHTPLVVADPVVEDPAVVEPVAYPVAPAPVAPAAVAPGPASVPTASAPAVSAPIDTPPTPAVEAPIVAGPAAPKFLEPRGKAPPPPVVAPRARLTCDIRPLRAGLNFLSATVECELVVANTGDAHAEAIRAGVALLAAHAGHDADLAAFNAAWVARPAATPFALAPGETRTIRTVVAIARDAIQPMTAANRPMFVPVVATNILYTTNGDDAQAARAWVVGIERVDSAKLAPFWLDAPARMFTTVAARPHGATFDR